MAASQGGFKQGTKREDGVNTKSLRVHHSIVARIISRFENDVTGLVETERVRKALWL